MPRWKVAETDRLILREILFDDAPFILRLLNEPSFIQNIGDRGVRSLDDARLYVRDGPMASYERHGFGLWLVVTKPEGTPIGMCGLVKRDALEDVDVGFAFVPESWGGGYATEAALASIDFGRRRIGLKRIAGITNPDNFGSMRVLEKCGLKFERMVRLAPEAKELRFFAKNLEATGA